MSRTLWQLFPLHGHRSIILQPIRIPEATLLCLPLTSVYPMASMNTSQLDFAGGKTFSEGSTGGPDGSRRRLQTWQPMERTTETGGIELGTIRYVNRTDDGQHGDYEIAMEMGRRHSSLSAGKNHKPLWLNFVQWPGWQVGQDVGRQIFSHPIVQRAAEELFIPCVFNTWDRNQPMWATPMRTWGMGLSNSWWGYLRIVDTKSWNVVSGTGQLTSSDMLNQVLQVMRESLDDLGIEIPAYLEEEGSSDAESS